MNSASRYAELGGVDAVDVLAEAPLGFDTEFHANISCIALVTLVACRCRP
jgi:hypothetical protein